MHVKELSELNSVTQMSSCCNPSPFKCEETNRSGTDVHGGVGGVGWALEAGAQGGCGWWRDRNELWMASGTDRITSSRMYFRGLKPDTHAIVILNHRLGKPGPRSYGVAVPGGARRGEVGAGKGREPEKMAMGAGGALTIPAG